MSTTGGSFNLPQTTAAAAANLSKEIESFFTPIPGGAAFTATINPTQPQQGFTVYNVSQNYLKGLVLFVTGITSVTTATERLFLIPPGGTYSLDLGVDAESANAAAALHPIDSIQFQTVVAPQTAGTFSTAQLSLTGISNTNAGGVVVNFVSS
jgi:hypothetical protein